MEKINLQQLERQINDLSHNLTDLARDGDFKELIKIIHQPGWTTPAELTLVTGTVESMIAQSKALIGLKQALIKGSREVTTKGAATA